MLTDEKLGNVLGRELDDLSEGVSPRPDLADRVVSTRRRQRHRTRGLGAAAALVLAGAAALSIGAPAGSRHGTLEAHLASYRFALPRDATGVSASTADCALRATVTFPNASGETSGIGVSEPDQSAVASAVLSDGGCVSMLLSNPYSPNGANMPAPAFPVVDSRSISIAGDQGTVGTYEFLGSATNGDGVSLSGARNVEVTLQIPVGNRQFQIFLVAAAGVTERQLESIVASGLTTN
jgi:hypothetical protein